jgi:hypothetical protein
VLVLSESYLAESGASLPWPSIVNPTDRRVRLVPVKVDECSPPPGFVGEPGQKPEARV